jgi:hypothetical protein
MLTALSALQGTAATFTLHGGCVRSLRAGGVGWVSVPGGVGGTGGQASV